MKIRDEPHPGFAKTIINIPLVQGDIFCKIMIIFVILLDLSVN